MSDDHFDILIIGAGPAGSMAAFLAAKEGLRTLLIEKESFPRYKVCGGSLSPLAVRILKEVGLETVLDSCIALDSMKLFVSGYPVPFQIYGRYSIGRDAFDEELVHAAQRVGASVLFESTAVIKASGSEGCTVEVKDKQQKRHTYTGNLIINASGLSSEVLNSMPACKSTVSTDSYLGFGTTVADNNSSIRGNTFIRMNLSDAGYVGATKLPDNRINLAAAMHQHVVKQSDHKTLLWQSAREIVPELDLHSSELSWSGVPELKRRVSSASAKRVISIGDAASYVEPFTGEGIGWALYSGKLAAELALNEKCSEAIPEKWKSLYRSQIVGRQKQTQLVGDFLKSSFYQKRCFYVPQIGTLGTKLAYKLYRFVE